MNDTAPNHRSEYLWTWGIRAGATLAVLAPIVALVAGAALIDAFRVAVLTVTVIVMLAWVASLWDTLWRLRHLPYSAPTMRDQDRGRRDRLILGLILIGDEARQAFGRLGEPHLNYRTPLLIIAVWLALNITLKIDVRRWRSIP